MHPRLMVQRQVELPGTGSLEEHFDSARRRPHVALRPYVAWYTGYRQVGFKPGRHRGLPSPYLTMIVTLDELLEVAVPSDSHEAPGVYQTLLGGLHKRPTIISHPGKQSGIQLALEPLGARALLGLPAGEIANIDVPASDVLGTIALEMYVRIRLAASWFERFEILDELLLRRLEPGRLVAHEVAAAWCTLKRSSGRVAIDRLAHSVGWSSRHLASAS